MSTKITAQQIIDRIKDQFGTTWKDSTVDEIKAGKPDTQISGITTSYTPSIEVLRRSVASGKNLLITRQPAFYMENRSPSVPGMNSKPLEELLKDDPAYMYKREFIDKNNLVIWRFYENWNARETDGQLQGLTKSLSWDEYHIPASGSGEEPYSRKNRFFVLPESTLGDMMIKVQDKLKIVGTRVIGDPMIKIRKAALSPGIIRVPELQEILKEPDVDLLVIGQPIEWEVSPYFEDLVAWGKKQGMIIIGLQASEEPGSGEMASWLKTFISEVPVDWIPAGEPFWIP